MKHRKNLQESGDSLKQLFMSPHVYLAGRAELRKNFGVIVLGSLLTGKMQIVSESSRQFARLIQLLSLGVWVTLFYEAWTFWRVDDFDGVFATCFVGGCMVFNLTILGFVRHAWQRQPLSLRVLLCLGCFLLVVLEMGLPLLIFADVRHALFNAKIAFEVDSRAQFLVLAPLALPIIQWVYEALEALQHPRWRRNIADAEKFHVTGGDGRTIRQVFGAARKMVLLWCVVAAVALSPFMAMLPY